MISYSFEYFYHVLHRQTAVASNDLNPSLAIVKVSKPLAGNLLNVRVYLKVRNRIICFCICGNNTDSDPIMPTLRGKGVVSKTSEIPLPA